MMGHAPRVLFVAAHVVRHPFFFCARYFDEQQTCVAAWSGWVGGVETSWPWAPTTAPSNCGTLPSSDRSEKALRKLYLFRFGVTVHTDTTRKKSLTSTTAV